MSETPTSPYGPIFIVGSSRSGTTLLRQILNGHDRVWITGETHYFDDLRPSLGGTGSTKLDGDARTRCERYFARFGQAGSGRHLAELRREAGRLGGTADAYFEAFCRLNASRRGREIWGEKTPRHVFRVAEMIAAYPGARVICLVRDPRAVVASYRDSWQRALFGRRRDPKAHARMKESYVRAKRQYDIVLTGLLWNATVRAGYDARARFGPDAVCIQRYEELITTTEDAVRRLTAWLGIEYQEAMLAGVRVVASSYVNVEGKRGISGEPLARWRATLTPEEIAVVQMIAGRHMREVGYEREETRASALRVAATLLAVPVGVLQAVAANRHRLGRTFEFGRRRLAPLFVRRPLANGQ